MAGGHSLGRVRKSPPTGVEVRGSHQTKRASIMTKATSTQTFQNNDNTETVAASLATLEISALNPRQNPNEEGLEALALSIKAVGLLQNLIGIKKGKKIGIIAGGRRLRALQLLRKKATLQKMHPSWCA